MACRDPLLLEIFDFPALYGHFDAHSLWHLATIPLGIHNLVCYEPFQNTLTYILSTRSRNFPHKPLSPSPSSPSFLGFIWAIFWRLDATEHIGGGDGGNGDDGTVNESSHPVTSSNATSITASMDDDGHTAVGPRVRTRARTKATGRDKG